MGLSKGENISQLTDSKQLAGLVRLQKGLIRSGFRLLKKGGLMVYSTCSLSEDQNEGVVKWLLDNFEEAFVIPVHFADTNKRSNEKGMIREGKYPGTVRFSPVLPSDPVVSPTVEYYGGGFFLAKIGKR